MGSAQALDLPQPQIFRNTFIVDVGVGGSRTSGDLGIDFNNNFFNDQRMSFSTTRGFVTFGVETPGPRIGQSNLVFGARSQVFFNSELFNVNFDLPQRPNDQVRMIGRNAFNITPFVGIDLPIDRLISAQESQARVRIFGGPTFSDQRLTVDLDANGNHQVQSFDKLVSGVTVGVQAVSTRVLVPDGQTVLLGGPVDIGVRAGGQVTFQRGVPGFGDIPFLGALFTQHRNIDASVELQIFVTPRLVTPTDN
jgi:hypothetical protein